jgi:hypothetical protein
MTLKINVHFLRELGANEDDIARFKKVFGDEAEITQENVQKACEAKLEVVRLATHRERTKNYQICNAAWLKLQRDELNAIADNESSIRIANAEYDHSVENAEAERARGTHLFTYKHVMSDALVDHLRRIHVADVEFHRIIRVAQKEYWKINAEAEIEYKRVRAMARIERDFEDWATLTVRIVSVVEDLQGTIKQIPQEVT